VRKRPLGDRCDHGEPNFKLKTQYSNLKFKAEKQKLGAGRLPNSELVIAVLSFNF